MQTLRARDLSDWLQPIERYVDLPAPQLLDVREAWELQKCSLDNVIAIPLGQVPAQVERLDPQRPVVCICHHGWRSLQAAAWLERNGFDEVYNLSGGVAAWANEVDPQFPTY
ncbi:MAG: sulfurtransferase [Burkholderiaceae bacterium]|nr:MAG: sulfurtransferase [Burkholderiaceae bacterium]